MYMFLYDDIKPGFTVRLWYFVTDNILGDVDGLWE
jgi:hypothetical protein